ncbi:hypothetical protein PANA5342_2967 [Pantoea ananatis LMG 5342]|nr:hypothetical protein PANA5342_2967 [Pantoea ananatis LMG 5342]
MTLVEHAFNPPERVITTLHISDSVLRFVIKIQ